MQTSQHPGSVKTLCAIISLLGSGLSFGDGIALEEVVVSAQKREESLQNTPISIAAFTTEELKNKGIAGLNDLRNEVPNLQMTPHPNSTATLRVFMRGVGNNDDVLTRDPSVAVYVDGVYVARSQGMATDVVDIERVEVLRGPQGALYGRNATGGAINFISKEPELGSFGFQQDFSAGSDNLFRSRTLLNVPLAANAAVQLSYLKSSKDGFVRNLGTGVSRFGDQDREAYRVALHWQPVDALDLRYSYDHSLIEDTPAYMSRVPFYPAQGKRPNKSSPFVKNLQANDITVAGHNMTASWEINDALSLKSITAYRTLDNLSYMDYNTGVFGPVPVFDISSRVKQHQFSQELQAVGDTLDSRLNYVAGLYYFDESGKGFDVTDSSPLGGAVVDRWITIGNTAYAMFGQATYTPAQNEQLHVTVGARYSRDHRRATLSTLSTTVGGIATASPLGDGDRRFSNFSPNLIIAYDLSPDINAYASLSKGYKTGGFNVRSGSIGGFEQGFGPENITSYELGLKSLWWDNRVRLNADVFRSKYRDIQVGSVNPSNPTVVEITNAGEALIKGFEAELSARLSEGLTTSLNYGWLDADFTSVKNAAGQDISSTFYYVEAPRSSYTANLKYEFPATPIGTLTALVDYSWQSKRYSDFRNKNYTIDAYGVLNARLTLTDIPLSRGNLSVAVWGRNLEDKQYYTTFFNGGVPSAFFGDPRSFGVDATFKY